MTPEDMMRKWYSDPAVRFQIFNTARRREMVFLMSKYDPMYRPEAGFRMVRVRRSTEFDHVFKYTGFFRDRMNMYVSVAEFHEDIPYTYNVREDERKRMIDEFKESLPGNIKSYDFFIDIDADDHHDRKAYLQMVELHRLFNDLGFPHMVIFSGNGFHFVTPQRFFKGEHHYDNYVDGSWQQRFSMYAKVLGKIYDRIDGSIYDTRRVRKMPYSLIRYKEDFYICTPLNTEDEIERFNVENYRLGNQKFNPYNRTPTLYNPEGDGEALHRWIADKATER